MSPPGFRRASRPAFRLSYARRRPRLGPKSPPPPGIVYVIGASMLLMGAAPFVEATKSVEVSVPAASMEMVAVAPLVGSGAYVEAVGGSLELQAGAVLVSADRSVAVPAASMLMGGGTPTVAGVKSWAETLSGASMEVGAGTPVAVASTAGGFSVVPSPASMLVRAGVPVVDAASLSVAIASPSASMALGAGTASVLIVSTVDARPTTASMQMRASAPGLLVTATVSPAGASLLLRGGTPAASISRTVQAPAASMLMRGAAPEWFALPAPEPGSYLGWDSQGRIVNLTPTAILDQIASATPLPGWWIDTGA